MNRHLRIAAALAFFLPVAAAFGQQSPATQPQYATMTAALKALAQANDDTTRAGIYNQIDHLPLETPGQLMTLYDLDAGFENQLTAQNVDAYLQFATIINHVLSTATDARFADALALALKKEFDSMPRPFLGGESATTGAQKVRYEFREGRLEALTGVIGATKDRKALPVLRQMLDFEGPAREDAAGAIGKIGDPADIEDFIHRLEKDPRTRINIDSFGPAAFDRVIQEIDNPSAPQQARDELAGSLRYTLTPQNKNKYIELLNHSNEIVREEVATALCNAATKNDGDLLIKIAQSPKGTTRLDAIQGMTRVWDARFIPVLLNMFMHDPSNIIRAEIAKLFGQHRVREAIPELQKATGERNRDVREAATDALQKIQ